MGRRRSKHTNDADGACHCSTWVRYTVAILLVVSVCLLYVDWLHRPIYSVAIGAISGLDPATDLQDGRALDPAFNLTIRLDASRGELSACLNESTSVQVSYLRLPLAVGRAPNDNYAAAGQLRDVEVVARGRGVVVPGFLLDSLAEDMRRGVAAFEVTLMSPSNGGWDVMTCWAKVGDHAALEAPCQHLYWMRVALPELQPVSSSVGGYLPLQSLGRKVVRDAADEDNGFPAAQATL